MAEKKTTLSIVLRTVDNATAKINAITKRIDALTKPMRDFGKALGELRDKSGLDAVLGGFKGVGSAITGILSKVAMVGGVVGVAVAGLFKLVDGFDDLGDKAEAAGVSVDFLASMRFAAERSGASMDQLDGGVKSLALGMGQLRAGTGKFKTFIDTLPPVMGRQLRATKSTEEAWNLLANAMVKIKDPAKRALFAQKAFGDAALAPLLAKGSKGIGELRDRYMALAGSQEGAAAEAGKVDDSLKDFKATTDGIKAALVQGLAPALKTIVDQLSAWFQGNRGRVAAFAASLGEKLPAAVQKLVGVFGGIVDAIRPFVDAGWKLKAIALVLVGIIVGPLVASIYTLGVAIMTTPIGWIVGGIALLAAGALLLYKHWGSVAAFFGTLWDGIKAAFAVAFDFLKGLFLNFTPLGIIIKHWEPIKKFFSDLWDGITGVFTRAWNIVKGIVDKVTGAVDAVKKAVKGAKEWLGGSEAGKELAAAQAERQNMLSKVPMEERVARVQRASEALRAEQQAKITVDIANAPRGTRVNADPQSTASVDLNVGYQMGMP